MMHESSCSLVFISQFHIIFVILHGIVRSEIRSVVILLWIKAFSLMRNVRSHDGFCYGGFLCGRLRGPGEWFIKVLFWETI